MPRRGRRRARASRCACTSRRSSRSPTPAAAGWGCACSSTAASGYAYGTDLSDEGVRALAADAHAGAAAADTDEYDGLPDASATRRSEGLYSAAIADWTTERKIELATAMDAAARGREGVTQVEQTVYADSRGRVAIANSRGFASAYEASSAWAYSSAFAGEGADLMTGLGVGLARDPGGLDPDAIGAEAGERARARRRAPAGEPPRARSCSTRSSRPASPASSAGCSRPTPSAARTVAVRGKLGEEVAASQLRLADDATDPAARERPFDGEGSPTRRNA